MEQITLRIQEDVLEDVESEAEDSGQSRAEFLREVIASRDEPERLRHEHEEKVERLQDEHAEEVDRVRSEVESEVDALESELDELQTEVERLRSEKRQILEQREEHTQLVKTVERERSLVERKQQAGIVTRAKWLLVGMPDDES